MGRRTLTRDEATRLSLRARTLAAAQIATLAMDQTLGPEVQEDLMRRAARIIAPIETTSADWMPRADAIEVASWEMAG